VGDEGIQVSRIDIAAIVGGCLVRCRKFPHLFSSLHTNDYAGLTTRGCHIIMMSWSHADSVAIRRAEEQDEVQFVVNSNILSQISDSSSKTDIRNYLVTLHSWSVLQYLFIISNL
jgi:hypothetical protein